MLLDYLKVYNHNSSETGYFLLKLSGSHNHLDRKKEEPHSQLFKKEEGNNRKKAVVDRKKEEPHSRLFKKEEGNNRKKAVVSAKL